jgi:hypothetical protein
LCQASTQKNTTGSLFRQFAQRDESQVILQKILIKIVYNRDTATRCKHLIYVSFQGMIDTYDLGFLHN